MMKIELKNGKNIIVDASDYEEIAKHGWHISHNGYAIRRVEKKGEPKRVIYMHKQIFGEKGSFDIDHIDGNKLNNSKSNLRLATRSLNNANQKIRTGCSSVFKGVAWVKNYKRWWAYIGYQGKRTSLGYFTDEVEAAKAYNQAAIKMFGEFCRLNPV